MSTPLANKVTIVTSVVQIETITRVIAFGRLGEPEDIARVVLFLASEEAEWITRQTLRPMEGSSSATD